MKKNNDLNQYINAGGINGLGEGLINTNSKDFLALKSLIKTIAADQSQENIVENEFLAIRFQMESYLNESANEIIQAGEFIERLLKVVHIKKKTFAKYIGYEGANLSALLKGRRKINPDLAIKLGKIFRMNPAIWLHIESKNDLMKELKGKEEIYKHYNLIDLMKKAV